MPGRRHDLRAPRRFFVTGAASLVTVVVVSAVWATPAVAAPPRPITSACGSYSQPLVDVSSANPHHPGISCLFLWEVASGTSPGRYSPDRQVTRAEMATFIARLLTESGASLPSSPPNQFSDVDPASTHARAINQLASVGIVSGSGGRYNPAGQVSRAQMATFLMGAAALVAGDPLPPGGNAFTDDAGNVHEQNINRAANAGVAAGTGGSSFTPAGKVTRAQMGSFLARLLSLFVDDYGVPTRAEDPDPPFGPLYRFIVPPGTFGNSQPARWDPCAAPTIPWRITGPSQPGWDNLVTSAFADAAAGTGLQVTRNQGFAGSRRIDIEFRPAEEFPPDVVGLATFDIVETTAGEPEFLAGHIAFNSDFLELVTDPEAGPLAAEAARILMLHEVGHIFGLDHVDDPQLLMAPNLEPEQQDPFYGQGELDGMALLGASQGCIPR